MMNRTILSFSLILGLGLLLAACAPAGGDATRSARGPITAAEIADAGITTTALDAVQRVRPQWMHTRGGQQVRVYLDGNRFGNDIRSLAGIPAGNVHRIEQLSPQQATTRWGGGHLGGAIHVETR
jgi:hypothetical protein